MMERKHGNKSWLLSKIIDYEVLGTQEEVDIKRRNILIKEYMNVEDDQIYCIIGSKGEGNVMWQDSDVDVMKVMPEVVVLYSESYPGVAETILNKTVFFLRKADCQPGYVALELAIQGKNMHKLVKTACVQSQNSIFISSDMFRQANIDMLTRGIGRPFHSNGPCATINPCPLVLMDSSCAFLCLNWPREALAWISRTRIYGWPSPALINKIVLGGCHVVPVGDKCSKDTFLQWRVSFALAERQLVHSLNHLQMKVFALMKHFVKLIPHLLRGLVKEDDILSSYFVKTIIFYAVENSPLSLWQDNNIFTCFQFCLSILIDWVRSGYCPHYFIPQNNLFLRKVCGQNQQYLLLVLLALQDMKWNSLSVGISRCFSLIENILEGLDKGETSSLHHIYPSLEYLEFCTDSTMYQSLCDVIEPMFTYQFYSKINKAANALQKPHTDKNEFILYRFLIECLVRVATDIYARNITSVGNKQIYKNFKKCKHLLGPLASLCASPGKLYLATFHYLVGNYSQVLHLCKLVTSSFRLGIFECFTRKMQQQYSNTFCGKGFNWYQKRDGFASSVLLEKQFCPQELLLEARRQLLDIPLYLPPLPYALFLTFLCHFHLGDIRRCLESLSLLQRKCEESAYCSKGSSCDKIHEHDLFWIAYTLLGICYQYVGDYSRAIAAFGNSLKLKPDLTHNPAKERIAMTYLLMCYQNWKCS